VSLADFEFFFVKMLLSELNLTHMIGKDDNQEEVSFKVADRRKFNPDGSLKEGVTLEAAKQEEKPAEPVASAAATKPEPPKTKSTAPFPEPVHEDEFAGDEDDFADADDPASFVHFLSTLATNAAAALGAVPHPATGQRSLDLETGKYWLDVLGMLRDKTKGNLSPQEARLLEGLLADLRMQYVQLVRATEEKLKQQAAKKFSNADILGKK
jgi:hypothetical protein